MARDTVVAAVPAAGIAAGLGYYLVVTGKLTVDTGWGRRLRPLGLFGVTIAAPAAAVFDLAESLDLLSRCVVGAAAA